MKIRYEPSRFGMTANTLSALSKMPTFGEFLAAHLLSDADVHLFVRSFVCRRKRCGRGAAAGAATRGVPYVSCPVKFMLAAGAYSWRPRATLFYGHQWDILRVKLLLPLMTTERRRDCFENAIKKNSLQIIRSPDLAIARPGDLCT